MPRSLGEGDQGFAFVGFEVRQPYVACGNTRGRRAHFLAETGGALWDRSPVRFISP
jgi:hypothetical protein